jgi:threonine/homoserine/homoserine lactone efflux protein
MEYIFLMENWAVLIPILLSDILNPVLFTFMVYAAGSKRPVATSSAMLVGHTVAYMTCGVVLAYSIEQLSTRLANPKTIDFIIEFLIACALLWLVLRTRKDSGKRPDEQTPEFTIWKAFTFGAVVNLIGIPFAVPYFAAIDQMLKSELDTSGVLTGLGIYNLAYALPFLMIPLLTAIMGDRSKPILARINGTMEKASEVIMPLLLLLIGLALLLDSLWYFVYDVSFF